MFEESIFPLDVTVSVKRFPVSILRSTTIENIIITIQKVTNYFGQIYENFLPRGENQRRIRVSINSVNTGRSKIPNDAPSVKISTRRLSIIYPDGHGLYTKRVFTVAGNVRDVQFDIGFPALRMHARKLREGTRSSITALRGFSPGTIARASSFSLSLRAIGTVPAS